MQYKVSFESGATSVIIEADSSEEAEELAWDEYDAAIQASRESEVVISKIEEIK